MEIKQNTYTYTARNSNDPARVITFTLHGDYMSINLTGLLDEARTVASAEERSKALKHEIISHAKPAMMKMKEGISGPIHVGDIAPKLDDDLFQITVWPRFAGLRLMPVRFDMGQVDNQDAAEAFVQEVMQRKKEGHDQRKFIGPLDYWLGWAGLLLLIVLIIRRPGEED